MQNLSGISQLLVLDAATGLDAEPSILFPLLADGADIVLAPDGTTADIAS